MAQQIINIGASANDGQGDPIRTAFAKTNNNFTQLFGIGASQIIYNGTSNVNLPFLNGNVFISVGGVGNVMVIDSTGANIDGTLEVTGNVTGGNLLTNGVISATGDITGATLIGSYIQGIVTTASQTQITELGTLTSLAVGGNISSGNMLANGDVSVTGNLTVNGNATLSGNILGDRVQNGTTSFDIQTQNGNANITVAGTSNVVVFSTTGVYVTGLISATGNATAGNILTGGLLSATGNATVGNILTGGLISATGNIAGSYIFGNGSQLTSLPAPSVTVDNTSVGYMDVMLYDGTIKYTANLTVEPASGNIITLGNVSVGNIIANNIGNIAALSLDGNASTVLYGNGTFAPVAGGSGNATYIVNGNSYANIATASGNLEINVGSDGYGIWNFEAGTGNLIGPGNATQGAGIVFSADQSVYIREDMGDLNIDAFHTQITSNSGNVGNTYSWDFDSSGNLSIPGGGSVYNIGVGTAGITANITSGNVYLGLDDTTGTTTLFGNSGVQIGTNVSISWTFDANGNLALPNGGHLGNIYGITALESAGSGAALIQNANCYVGVAADESFTVVAASQVWTFSNANAAATLQCPVVAYAALPSATYAPGLRAFVNDSTVIAFGATVAGGAANTVPVWSDGTNWRVG